MKRIPVLLGFLLFCVAGYSQQDQLSLSFTKGDLAPGKISGGRNFEDFISGFIKVQDKAGNEYSLVQADVLVTSRNAKDLRFTMLKNYFESEQSISVISVSEPGTVYSFENIIVKDKEGKQLTVPAVKYELVVIKE